MFSDKAIAAQDMLRERRFEAAEELARAGLRIDPQDVGLRTVLAICLGQRGALSDAQREADEAIALNSSHAWPHVARSWVFVLRAHHDPFRRGDLLASALIELDRAMELGPDDTVVWQYLAEAQIAAENLPAAVQAARQALVLAPDNQRAACLLANALVQLDRVQEAGEVLEALPPEAAEDPDVQLVRGHVLLHAGQVEEAAGAIEQAIAWGCYDAPEANRLLRETQKARYAVYRPWLRWELWLARGGWLTSRRQAALTLVGVAVFAGWYFLILSGEYLEPFIGLAAFANQGGGARRLATFAVTAPLIPFGLVGLIVVLHAVVQALSEYLLEPHPWRRLGRTAACWLLALGLTGSFALLQGFVWFRVMCLLLLVLLAGGVAIGFAWSAPTGPVRRWAQGASLVFIALFSLFFIEEPSHDVTSHCILAAMIAQFAVVSMASSRGRRRRAWSCVAFLAVALSVAAFILILCEQLFTAGLVATLAMALAFAAIVYGLRDALRSYASALAAQAQRAERERDAERDARTPRPAVSAETAAAAGLRVVREEPPGLQGPLM